MAILGVGQKLGTDKVGIENGELKNSLREI
jgi:hypothetical protein